MIRKIITDEPTLSIKCEECDVNNQDFLMAISDLISTANSLKDKCGGLAFNQIGVLKRAFVIKQNGNFNPIINPEYVSRSSSMKSRFETCLSRPGKEPIKKRRHIKVRISHFDLVSETETISVFYGFEARVA